jgi:branched-chain amino acid transport system ATP-binding protein
VRSGLVFNAMSNEATQPALLAFEHVTVKFGGLLALNDVSFEVLANEIVGLIGPNGAGKTTAFNVACGFQKPTSGGVAFPTQGRRGLRPPQLARAGVARTLQGVGLFNHMSILENVMAGGQGRRGGGTWSSLLGLPTNARDERVLRDDALGHLHRLGIERFAEALPGGVPYGIAKKVSVARALMQNPLLLLLDEPASGLDERELEEFATLIVELRSSMSVLLVEHNMDFVMQLVNRIVVLNFGQVIAEGTPKDIMANEDVLAAYLGIDE